MAPVEKWPPCSSGPRSEGGHERLNESQACGYAAEDGVRVVCRRPALQFNEDDDKTGHGQAPSENHENPVPLQGRVIKINQILEFI